MKNRHKSKRRTTIVILYPELAAHKIIDRTINELSITRGKVAYRIDFEIGESELQAFCTYRNPFYNNAIRERLLGKTVIFLVYVGDDIMERVRKVVGIQQNPNDWIPTTINGKFWGEFDWKTVTSVDGKKFYHRPVECALTHTAVRRWIRFLAPRIDQSKSH
ncbi:MAG TPA: hypothetical protein VL335_01395 [Candidatus Paceibacterota bacterium]|jgi:nucleoside diphosphate kinase|nr:hypothetical protein [Candidatus Paceibacterota bacterium]